MSLIHRQVSDWSYVLTPRGSLNAVAQPHPRQGALLKIRFEDPATGEEKCGYSDCFPWPEFGDRPLGEQLRLLRENKLTPLTQRSLAFARVDAVARAAHRNLFEGVEVPPSHFFLNEKDALSLAFLVGVKRKGFDKIKIKVGRNPLQEAQQISSWADVARALGIKFRLDFNGSLNLPSFHRFMGQLGSSAELLDFIEDPIPFDLDSWAEIQLKWNLRLALDRMPEEIASGRISPESLRNQAPAFSLLILKPALQDPEFAVRFAQTLAIPLVVTSSLDHPLGQACAAWVASQIVQEGRVRVETCGLLSQKAYHPHLFSDEITAQGPQWASRLGSGFGMDALLQNLPFQEWECS